MKTTPLMEQYNSVKSQYPDTIILFRMGDFYETFADDAKEVSEILNIVLTKRGNGSASEVLLAGFPYHSLEAHLPKLVMAGKRVAICDQLEDPKKAKGLVKRGVTEIVSPGVKISDNVLNPKTNNFLAAIEFDKKGFAVSFLDISTGDFLFCEGDFTTIKKLIESYSPGEIVVRRNLKSEFINLFGDKWNFYVIEDWAFNSKSNFEILKNHFKANSLKGFGIDESMSSIISAAGAAINYVHALKLDKISHIRNLKKIDNTNYMWIDDSTFRNLEIFDSANDKNYTLLNVLDKTATSMGSRLLKSWLSFPLISKQEIENRYSVVEFFISAAKDVTNDINKHLHQIGDLQRYASKIATGKINPIELYALAESLSNAIIVLKICKYSPCEYLKKIATSSKDVIAAVAKITKTISKNAGPNVSKGNVINDGVNIQLDALRDVKINCKQKLNKIWQEEVEKSNMPKLKISSNNVSGIFFEINKNAVKDYPSHWIRKGSTTTTERFVTPALRELSNKIANADISMLEYELMEYQNLISELNSYIADIQINAELIAQIDVLGCFAKISENNNYTKPEITDSRQIYIEDGRHPVIEHFLKPGLEYVSNGINIDNDKVQIAMITGPNMSGKSAFLRQIALISIMAQIGCFVPCSTANLSIVDRLFCRVGASDNISAGESTFMVEMNEASNILNNISERSLVILDEIGRGTSTYDGISIAWAIAEFLHQSQYKPKTLFATHYHELNQMPEKFKRIKNFCISVKESDNKVIFLRKLLEGASNHSFGIHVAEMAGMPKEVIMNAKKIMEHLENNQRGKTDNIKDLKTQTETKPQLQLSFFQENDLSLIKIKSELEKIDVDNLTPLEALNRLCFLKNILLNK